MLQRTLWQSCFSEFLGSFALVLSSVGAVYHNASGAGLGLLGVALAQGLAMAAMIAVTGAQLNPAITFGFWVGKRQGFGCSLVYGLSQLAGAAIAGVLLVWLLPDASRTGPEIVAASVPSLAAHISKAHGAVIEALLTFLLVFAAFRAPRGVGNWLQTGLALGMVLTVGVLFAGPLTGGALNPARAFGPALASGLWTNQIVYWVGPVFGGGVAGLLCGRFLTSPPESSV